MTETKLLCAFMTLAMPDGMAGATHADARQVIDDLTGFRFADDVRPPPEPMPLEQYIGWARTNCLPS